MNTKTDRELLIQCVEAFAHICMVWSDKFSTESQQRIAKWFEEVTAHLAAGAPSAKRDIDRCVMRVFGD